MKMMIVGYDDDFCDDVQCCFFALPGECCFSDEGDVDGGVVDENDDYDMMMTLLVMGSGVSQRRPESVASKTMVILKCTYISMYVQTYIHTCRHIYIYTHTYTYTIQNTNMS